MIAPPHGFRVPHTCGAGWTVSTLPDIHEQWAEHGKVRLDPREIVALLNWLADIFTGPQFCHLR